MAIMTGALPIPPVEREFSSVITDPVDPSVQARLDKEDRRSQEQRTLIEGLVFDALLRKYVDGRLSFEWMCRYAQNLLSDQPTPYAERLVGNLVKRALEQGAPPAPVKSEAEAAWSQLAFDIVVLGNERDGTGVTKMFPIVANRFAAMRIVVSESQVKRWYYERLQTS